MILLLHVVLFQFGVVCAECHVLHKLGNIGVTLPAKCKVEISVKDTMPVSFDQNFYILPAKHSYSCMLKYHRNNDFVWLANWLCLFMC